MKNLVRRLIAEERRIEIDSGKQYPPGFRICEKLRQPLGTLTGLAGFRALLSRALVLAKTEAALLEGVQIKLDGTFQFSPGFKAQSGTEQAAKAGEVLASQLLGLLVTFVGESLTHRLVQDVWPEASTSEAKNEGTQS